MKIIEALKQLKDLERKADDLQKKVMDHTAIMDFEDPVYKDQHKKVRSWIDAFHGIQEEILRLHCAIQVTNLQTPVEIKISDAKAKTRTIAEWVIRRRKTAKREFNFWAHVNDRGLVTKPIVKKGQTEPEIAKVIRFYDPEERDTMVERLRAEDAAIDAALEIVNAKTDLIE